MNLFKKISIIILCALISFALFSLISGMQDMNIEKDPVILAILNGLFMGLIPISVGVIAISTYLKNDLFNALIFGCGMLLFGFGSASTSIMLYLNQDNNVIVTVYNISAFLASLCHLFAALQFERIDHHPETRKDKRLKFLLAISVIFVSVLTINHGAVIGFLPMFINANGFTSIRYIVLSMAIAFYCAAALLSWKQYRKLKTIEHFCYALALSFISLGLFDVCITSGMGTLLGWLGRVTQYIGAGYALLSVVLMYKKIEIGSKTIGDIMIDFFSDKQASFMNLINASPDAILSIDDDYEIFIANKSANMLFRMEPNSMIKTSFLDFLERPYKDQVKKDVDVYRRTGKSTLIGYTEEMIARDSAGRIFPVEISFAGRRLKSTFAVTLIIRDITQRKRIEDDLLESQQNALSLIKELEKSDKNKSEFIGVMSHELRNPLAAIVSGLNLMEMAETMEQITRTKVIIDRQIKHLCKLVDDLLDLTRISQNKMKLNIEPMNLNEIVLGAINDMEPQYEKKGVRLEIEMEMEPICLTGDAVRIAQVIINLLSNGLKFTQVAGMVNLTLGREGHEAVIKVKDNGAGMSQKIANEIFTSFVQAEDTIDRSNGGLGLGLSIVKGIVDLHGGQVSAFSEGPGKGSEFIVRLAISEVFPNNVAKEN